MNRLESAGFCIIIALLCFHALYLTLEVKELRRDMAKVLEVQQQIITNIVTIESINILQEDVKTQINLMVDKINNQDKVILELSKHYK